MRPRRRTEYRLRRHLRLRRKVAGTPERPRMSVFVSGRHMYVQFVDDLSAHTLAAVSTVGKKNSLNTGKNNLDAAKQLGAAAARAAREKGIEQVVFDRGGFAFKGRVKILADAAREQGLKF
jgi:large subunit ribosomal protein L18